MVQRRIRILQIHARQYTQNTNISSRRSALRRKYAVMSLKRVKKKKNFIRLDEFFFSWFYFADATKQQLHDYVEKNYLQPLVSFDNKLLNFHSPFFSSLLEAFQSNFFINNLLKDPIFCKIFPI